MKKHLFLILLSLVGMTAQAQIPNGYYNAANGKQGNELKVALHNIIKGHTSISYNNLWNAYWSTDNKGNGIVWDIYTDIPNGTPVYSFTLGTDQCGSYQKEGDCYNREHSWPESWFNSDGTARTDLHHIFPTDGWVNNLRSSYPYGEVKNASNSNTSSNGSKLGTPKTELGYSGDKVFEPIDAYKGDIARAYFYMSVRYYSEDGSWGSSGMTNKSEILPWAMTMLLRWSDEDPVSQKEIDRNNVIYNDYQHNRNPFIDHPEYARMIWDPNYSPTPSYAITYNNVSNGSVTGPNSANEGSTVAIIATPAAGYKVSDYSVYKTGSPNTTVSVSSNGTFTMPGYAVTVSATFTLDNTYYTIDLGSVSHGTISANTYSAKSGTTITLTATPTSGYSLNQWYVYKTGDMNTTVNVTNPNSNNASFTMPAYNVTVQATFVQGSGGNGNYVKVTSTSDITDNDDYLIVCENNNVAFNGGLETLDGTGNTIPVTISNGNTIEATETTNAAKFTISSVNGKRSIRSASGYYIGQTSNDNGLKANQTTVYENTISYNNGNIDIVGSGGPYLRYNATSGQERFRYFKSSTYTSQKAIQLYKKTSGSATTPTHTIHFDKNGGAGTMNDQTVNEFEPTALTGNAFTRTGFVFDGWNTAANGTGTYYADGATVTLLDDITLYAQWDPLFTVTCATGLTGGTISATPTSAVEGTTITLSANPSAGYELGSWTVTGNEGNIDVENNQFEMPAGNVTVNATFTFVGLPFEQHYYLVTSTDQLVAGRTYLIVNTAYQKALGTTQNNNNRSAAEVSVSSNMISSIGNDVCELTLGGQSGAWTFYDSLYTNNNVTGGYLFAASSSSNYLRTQASNDANGQWTITISNGVTTIKANGTNTHNLLKYNSQNNIFSCYGSGQLDVQLFIRSEEYPHTSSETVANIFDFDKHIVKSGSTLTVTGTATCIDPSHLIIEDGGQLVHDNGTPAVTMKKHINGYSGDHDNYYLIASPFDVSPSDVTNMLSGDYDLYEFDYWEDLEWQNYEQGNWITMWSMQGYLYANSSETDLQFIGTVAPSTDNTMDYNSYYSEGGTEDFNGWALAGNPFACNAYPVLTNGAAANFYKINGDEITLSSENFMRPLEGIFLQFSDENTSYYFNRTAPVNGKGLDLAISGKATTRGETEQDMIRICFDQSNNLEKLQLHPDHMKLYIPQNGKDYAVVNVGNDIFTEIPINFKASENGAYTLTLSGTPHSSLLTPHLLDNITGADIDLLATPTYTFTAKTTDYESRFRLVFSANDNTGNTETGDTFAFIDASGNLNVNGDGMVQVIDIMGRIIVDRRDGACTVSTANVAPGVYVLRLINGDNVKIQKIVIN